MWSYVNDQYISDIKNGRLDSIKRYDKKYHVECLGLTIAAMNNRLDIVKYLLDTYFEDIEAQINYSICWCIMKRYTDIQYILISSVRRYKIMKMLEN